MPSGPGRRVEPAQVVGGEAGPDDQRALVAQGRELAAEVEQRRAGRGSASTSAGRGCRPRGTSPRAARRRRGRGRGSRPGGRGCRPECTSLATSAGELGRTRGGIRHLVVVPREALEVVHERDLAGGGAQRQRRLLPVGRDHEDVRGACRSASTSRRAGRVHTGSSASGGAPWLRYSTGWRVEVAVSLMAAAYSTSVEHSTKCTMAGMPWRGSHSRGQVHARRRATGYRPSVDAMSEQRRIRCTWRSGTEV